MANLKCVLVNFTGRVRRHLQGRGEGPGAHIRRTGMQLLYETILSRALDLHIMARASSLRAVSTEYSLPLRHSLLCCRLPRGRVTTS